jgi:DNA-binding MarR family transcriptional regulator
MGNPTRASARPANDHVDELVSAMVTASRALVAVSATSLADLDEALTIPQFRTLVVLSSHGEINLNRLADILHVNSSSAMRMADRLLGMGLVTRRENPENRRHTLIGITGDGLAIVRKVTTRRRREIKKIVSRMEGQDREALVRALSAFADAAEEPHATGPADELSPLGW